MASEGPECSICLEGYNDKAKFPRMLSCGHSFCSSCLERLLYGNTIRCPTCRSLIVVPTGVAGLSKNFDLLKIVNNQPKQAVKNTGRQVCEPCDKKHPATFCCLDCKENMCDTAAQIHKSSKLSRDHRVVTFKELKANPQLAFASVRCPEHNDQEFRFFDEDCGFVICRDCATLNHNGHKCVALAEAASKYRKEMEGLVIKASSQAEKIKAAEAQVRRASVSMNEACEEQRAELQGSFGELHAALNSREHSLMDKLVSLLQHKESILTGQQDRLRLNQACLESAVQQAKSSIQSASDVQFLLSRPAIVSTLKNKESYSLVLEPEAQFLPEFSKEQESKARFHSLITMATIFDPFDKLKKTIETAGDISDRSTCAANTTAIGEGTKEAFAGRKATFTIFSRDSQDRQRKQGGDVYAVKLIERGFEIRNVHVKDQKDGTYSVEYFVGNLVGKLTLSVCLRGEHIKSSPFSVLVKR